MLYVHAKKNIQACFVALILFCPQSLIAASIGLQADTLIVNQGEALSVDVYVTGIGQADAPTLGAYDFNLFYDPLLFGLSSVSFSSALGDDYFFEALLGVDEPALGNLNTYGISLLEESASTCIFCIDPYLEDIQSDSMVLATFVFNALLDGIGGFDLVSLAMSDGVGYELFDTNLLDNEISVFVQPYSVPEPSSLLLLFGGLTAVLSLPFFRKNRGFGRK